MQDYREIIETAYLERRARLPTYSFRAFAAELDVPASNLSWVLKKKKGLSQPTALKIAKKLGMTEIEQKTFCHYVEKAHARSPLVRAEAGRALEKQQKLAPNLTQDTMTILGQWHHFALLELLKIPSQDQSPLSLGDALGFKESEIQEALQRLINVGLIEVKQSRFHVVHDFNLSREGVPSEVLRKLHDQLLSKSKQALFSQAIEEREFNYSLLTLDQDDLPEAKQMMRSFLKTFREKFSKKVTAKHVYSVNLQLIKIV
ncbi:MAG: TIGR02147 family protein [Xanthomonadaceae bacterium]|nr:TIGR02147 family protein [Xanthomonadaceae bacterium]